MHLASYDWKLIKDYDGSNLIKEIYCAKKLVRLLSSRYLVLGAQRKQEILTPKVREDSKNWQNKQEEERKTPKHGTGLDPPRKLHTNSSIKLHYRPRLIKLAIWIKVLILLYQVLYTNKLFSTSHSYIHKTLFLTQQWKSLSAKYKCNHRWDFI